MQIYLKELKKQFNVKTTNRVMKSTYKVQLSMAKAQDVAETDDIQETVKKSLQMTEDLENYLKEVLKLNEKQIDALDELEFNDTIEMVNHVIMRVMGMSENDIKEAMEEEETGEKK